MPRIFGGGLLILLNSVLVLLVLSAVGNLKTGSAETPALINKKFEERAPAGELRNKLSRILLARTTPKAELGDWTVLLKATQGSMWTHEGSIVRLDAIGGARRFLYVEVHGAFPARSGDIAFEGVREGRGGPGDLDKAISGFSA
jgi:hypothetical protein